MEKISRILKNEKRLDNLLKTVHDLEIALDDFEKANKDYILLNKYYGSKSWFNDKENIEAGKITNVKAGVLSEDAVWNLDEEISCLLDKMKSILKVYNYEGSEMRGKERIN